MTFHQVNNINNTRCSSRIVKFVIFTLFLIPFAELVISSSNLTSNKMSNNIYACAFEVFGRVQGVFFRKYTQSQAQELGLRGWCMNTRYDTVKGEMQGPLDKINKMKEWLRTTGSPQSKIDKAEFSEIKEIPSYTFDSFSIKR